MFQTTDILKKRVYALTTDFFIIVVSNYFFMASFTHFLRTMFFSFPLRAQIFLIQKLAVVSSISLMSLTFAYFSIFYFVTNGRTMGKTLFGLKVVSPTGELTIVQSMKRAFAYFTCAMFGSFLFALSFIRKDDLSLADIMSGTTVMYDKKDEVEAALSGTEFQLSLVDAINETQEKTQEEMQETITEEKAA